MLVLPDLAGVLFFARVRLKKNPEPRLHGARVVRRARKILRALAARGSNEIFRNAASPEPADQNSSAIKQFRNCHVGVGYALIHRFVLPVALNSSKNRAASLLQVAKNLVQFTGSGKFLFERARSQVSAKLLERLDQLAQSTIQIVAVRENNITPDGIGTSRQAKRVTQAAARERHRQSGLIGLIAHHTGERDGEKLRKMRDN